MRPPFRGWGGEKKEEETVGLNLDQRRDTVPTNGFLASFSFHRISFFSFRITSGVTYPECW